MTMRQNTVRAVKGESTMRRAVEKFCRNKLAVISLIILLVLILLAVFAEKICTYDPLAENYKENGMIDKYSAPAPSTFWARTASVATCSPVCSTAAAFR